MSIYSNRTLKLPDINALDFQVDQAYFAFARAIETRSRIDTKWAEKMYDSLERTITITMYDRNFRDMKRGHKLAIAFDKYILSQTIGEVAAFRLSASGFKKYQKNKSDTSEFTSKMLMDAITSPRPSYAHIWDLNKKYIRDFEGILKILNAIRKNKISYFNTEAVK